MNIIVKCNELGELGEVYENEFRLVEVVKSDEQNVNNIVNHSIKKRIVKLTRVHVLYDNEYFTLKEKAKNFDEFKDHVYREWFRKAKSESQLVLKK